MRWRFTRGRIENLNRMAPVDGLQRMKRLTLEGGAMLTLLALALLLIGAKSRDKKVDLSRIHGRIEYVKSFPDYKVQEVKSFPDLKVQIVTSFPDKPGQWQIVDSFPDYKIEMVDSFPDFKVEFVTSFPGPTK